MEGISTSTTGAPDKNAHDDPFADSATALALCPNQTVSARMMIERTTMVVFRYDQIASDPIPDHTVGKWRR